MGTLSPWTRTTCSPSWRRLYEAFPRLERVTTYAGPISTLKKTPEELKALHAGGLGRVYLGVETGWDTLLKKVNKGVNAQQMLEAGLRLKEAGLELWAIVMLGLAGPGEASATHIQKTVEMINAMAPRHLSAMTYMPVEGTPMYQDILAGRFTCLTPREALLETRGLIAGADGGSTAHHRQSPFQLSAYQRRPA